MDNSYNHPIVESKISSWNTSTDCCIWEGVTCDEFTGKVIALDLSANRLTGVIDSNSSIFQLSHLKTLNLAYNNFSGWKISNEFLRFTHLSHLNLSFSEFQGQIPSEISQLNELISLDLSGYYGLTLSLEPHVFKVLLQNLTWLTELCLRNVLPENLSSSLTIIDLSYTLMNGIFPYHLFQLSNLQQLSFGSNTFDGYARLESVKWNSSSSLQKLDLHTIDIQGILSDTIGNLKHLTYLDLSGCKLNQTLPQSFGNLTQLTHLNLFNIDFSGRIPAEILGLQRLTFLNLGLNNLDTPIPHSATNKLKSLKSLSIERNQLNNTSVSSFIRNLTALESIDLTENPLYEIPLDIFELSSLQSIYLSGSQLQGPLPNSFSKLVNLRFLDFWYNNLSGPIETEVFSKLVNLRFLDLGFNKLSGSIEIGALSKLVNLRYLNLRSNNLSGPIEETLSNLANLTTLDLSFNNFGTTIDVKFLNNIRWMDRLDLSSSGLSLINESNTTLPMISIDNLCLGSCNIRDLDILRSILVLEDVYLSNNDIHGEIPEWVWSNWENVYALDLSNNFITHIGNEIPVS